MTRERQNRPDRTDAPAAAAAPSLQPAPDATAVILADGKSTRFRPGHRALATLDGELLVRCIVGMLQAMAGRPPMVTVRTAGQHERLAQILPRNWDVRFVCGDPGLSGSLTGVTAAADTVTTSRLFVAGCDMPLLEPHAVATLFKYAVRDDGDRDRDRNRCVSADGDRPSPPVIVPVSERGHEPLHTLCRCVAVRDNVFELTLDDDLGTFLNRLDGVEYVELSALPEGVNRSVTNVNTHTELARVAAGGGA